MRRLYYLGEPGDGYGWGVANTNLIRALGEFCEVITAPRTRPAFDAPIFVPIDSPDLKPTCKWKAPRILGYCFTEWPLPEDAHRHARAYDVIFAGSTWNTRKLQAAGIKHVQTLIQGVDFSLFQPQPPTARLGFVVFSGGKYEFRKGQDYVLAAMRRFMAQHADVVLLAAWHNPWPQSMASMNQSWLIAPQEPWQGIPEDRVIRLPPVPNEKTPQIYAQAHIGLFPNRCEAGTNLVMAEFMACGRPVIATYAHGHQDILTPHSSILNPPHPAGPYLLTNGSYDPAGWFNPEVSDILWHLEHAYNHRDQLAARGQACSQLVERFTWRDCAERIARAAFPSVKSV